MLRQQAGAGILEQQGKSPRGFTKSHDPSLVPGATPIGVFLPASSANCRRIAAPPPLPPLLGRPLMEREPPAA